MDHKQDYDNNYLFIVSLIVFLNIVKTMLISELKLNPLTVQFGSHVNVVVNLNHKIILCVILIEFFLI